MQLQPFSMKCADSPSRYCYSVQSCWTCWRFGKTPIHYLPAFWYLQFNAWCSCHRSCMHRFCMRPSVVYVQQSALSGSPVMLEFDTWQGAEPRPQMSDSKNCSLLLFGWVWLTDGQVSYAMLLCTPFPLLGSSNSSWTFGSSSVQSMYHMDFMNSSLVTFFSTGFCKRDFAHTLQSFQSSS